MQLFPTHSSPKFIRHHDRLPESFQVLQSCSACWKNVSQATGLLLTCNPNNSPQTKGASCISLGLVWRPPFWDFTPNTVGEVAQRARCGYSPCPVAVDLDPFTVGFQPGKSIADPPSKQYNCAGRNYFGQAR